MAKKISTETILCIPKSLNYYAVSINGSETNSIKYLELKDYLSTFLKGEKQTKTLNNLIKHYCSFIFIVSKQQFIELEDSKENLKTEIHDYLIDKSIKTELSNKKGKNNSVIDKIWDNLDKSGP